MKTLKNLVFVLLLTVVLPSCSKDEVENQENGLEKVTTVVLKSHFEDFGYNEFDFLYTPGCNLDNFSITIVIDGQEIEIPREYPGHNYDTYWDMLGEEVEDDRPGSYVYEIHWKNEYTGKTATIWYKK